MAETVRKAPKRSLNPLVEGYGCGLVVVGGLAAVSRVRVGYAPVLEGKYAGMLVTNSFAPRPNCAGERDWPTSKNAQKNRHCHACVTLSAGWGFSRGCRAPCGLARARGPGSGCPGPVRGCHRYPEKGSTSVVDHGESQTGLTPARAARTALGSGVLLRLRRSCLLGSLEDGLDDVSGAGADVSRAGGTFLGK